MRIPPSLTSFRLGSGAVLALCLSSTVACLGADGTTRSTPGASVPIAAATEWTAPKAEPTRPIGSSPAQQISQPTAQPAARPRAERGGDSGGAAPSARGRAAEATAAEVPGAATLVAIRADLDAGRREAAAARAEAAEPAAGGHPARLIGEAAQRAGDYSEAIRWYDRALSAGLSRSHQVNVYERLAQSAEAQSDWRAALGYYQEADARARTAAYRAEVGYRQATNLQRLGDAAGARDRWAETARTYPWTRYGARSLEALGLAGRDLVSAVTRGTIYEAQGELTAASEAYGKAIAQAAGPEAAAEARYLQALVGVRLDKPEAQQAFADIVNTAPGHERADDALWNLATAKEGSGNLDAAHGDYAALAAHYPASTWSDDALVEAGILAWRAGDTTTALASWDAAIDRYPAGDTASEALFWRGKVRAQRAGDAAGRADLEAAARFDDYYGYRAQAALRGEWRPTAGQAVAGDNWSAPFRTLTLDAAALGWLAGWTADPGATLDVTPDLAALAGFQRGQALSQAGLTNDDGLEYSDLADELTERPADLLRLAVWLQEQGFSPRAMNVGFQLDDIATRAGVADRPALLQRLLYPNAFADLVVRHSQERNLDPAWVLALLRQESSFNPTIQSPVGARGLAQIMPATGRQIAQALGSPNFDPRDLDRPNIAVDYGTFYLAGQLKGFRGDIMLTLAAYNAGGGAVSKWLDGSSTYADYDLFVESIPYRETRTYVKKIYVNYYRYRAIYGG